MRGAFITNKSQKHVDICTPSSPSPEGEVEEGGGYHEGSREPGIEGQVDHGTPHSCQQGPDSWHQGIGQRPARLRFPNLQTECTESEPRQILERHSEPLVWLSVSCSPPASRRRLCRSRTRKRDPREPSRSKTSSPKTPTEKDTPPPGSRTSS